MEFVKLGRGQAFRITRTHWFLGSEFKAGSEAKPVVGILTLGTLQGTIGGNP
jgi:hypothetical protein